jgi:hypothetical protein
MRLVRSPLLLWVLSLAAAGCAHRARPPAPEPAPTAPEQSVAPKCASRGTDGTTACTVSPVLLATPQLQEAVHDLRRLGLVLGFDEVGHGRVALTLSDEAVAQHTPLAYHLERFYRAYRTAYDLGDVVALELWRDGREIGSYTSQGLLLR